MRPLKALKRTILIADPEEAYGRVLADTLSALPDLAAEWIADPNKAAEAIREKRHHFAVIDINQDSLRDDGHAGIALHREIKTYWPPESHGAVVFMTAMGVEFYKPYITFFAHNVFPKNDLHGLSGQIQQLSEQQNITGYNWLAAISEDIATEITLKVGSTELQHPRVLAALEDVLRQLFRGCTRLIVTIGPEGGFSGAQLFKAAPPTSMGKARIYLIKLGRDDMIRLEAERTSRFVEPFSLDIAPLIAQTAYARVAPLGGLKIQLVSDAITLLAAAEHANSDVEIAKCCDAVRGVLSSLTETWYTSPEWTDYDYPTEVFNSAFMANGRVNFSECFPDIVVSEERPVIEWRACSNGVLCRAHNPLLALSPPMDPTRIPRSIAHGDLHCRNILVHEKSLNISLIDFAHTDKQWCFLDFAKLEISIIQDLLKGGGNGAAWQSRIDVLTALYDSLDYSRAVRKNAWWPVKITHVALLVETVRKCLADLVQRLHCDENSARAQYGAALHFHLVNSWWWLKDTGKFTWEDKTTNLLVISKIVDVMNKGKGKPCVTEVEH